MVLDSVAKRLYEPARVYLHLPKPVDIRNPFLMSPLLSHPGGESLHHLAALRAARFLHRRPPDSCLSALPGRIPIAGTAPVIDLLMQQNMQALIRGCLWRSLEILETAA